MSRLSKNIIYNFLGQILLSVLSFVAVRYIFKQLGADTLGMIYFTVAVNSIICAVLGMGISATIVREVSVYFKNEPSYVRDLIKTASLFYWIMYIILGVMIYFAAPIVVKKWINLKTMDTATAIQMLRILSISSLIGLPRSLYVGFIRGLQRMEFNNLIDVGIIGLQQSGIVIILALGKGLFYVVYWIAICYGLSIFLYSCVSAHLFSAWVLIPGYSSTVVKRNLKFSLRMISISILSMVHMKSDKVIISKLLPIGIFGYYGFAYGVVSKGMLITNSISHALLPSLSALFKLNERAKLMSQYRKLHDFVCLGIGPIFAAIPFALLPVFSYVFNDEVAKLLFLPTTLLCLGFYMNGTLNVPYVFSIAVGKPEITARMNFYALFVVLPITVFLIYLFGLIGAGLSWIFYHIFAYFYGIPRICLECLRIQAWEWYLHMLKVLVLIALTYGLAWSVLELINSFTITSFIVAYISASAIYVLGSYYIMGDELRKTVSSYMKNLGEFVTSSGN